MKMFIIGLSWEEIFSVYQIIIENDVYMCAGNLNVTINERLCKYNVTKSVTFITGKPIFTQHCYAHLEICHIKKLSLNMFRTKKANLDCFIM